ncbi:MAG TPA: cytochrome c biogenesis protein CcsA [Verrucomicrobiales bacterium]|nr:cytochrome c biogenesis protein CcsA [Verrucomicrobiales bacterium]
MKKWIPLIAALIFTAWILSLFSGPRNPKDGPPVVEFGQLPVVKDGRHQPMDSMARNALLMLRKKQTLNTEPWKSFYEGPVILPATQWMMELMMEPAVADTRPCFRIDNADLKNLLHVPIEPNEKEHIDGKHYTWNQIATHMDSFRSEVQRASTVKADLRNAYERALMDLWEATGIYKSLRAALGPAGDGDLAVSLPAYRQKLQEGRTAFQAQMEGQQFDASALEWAQTQIGAAVPLVIPEHGDKKIWSKAVEEVGGLRENEAPHYSLAAYGQMTAAWRAKDWPALTRVINAYRDQLKTEGALEKDVKKAKSEQFFNHMEIFYRGMIVAITALLFALLVWFAPSRFEWARKTAVWLTTLTLVLLAAGILWRMILEGRPPVTNLYSSALFIGMAAAALGLILELIWPYSIGVAVSSLGAFGTLLIAHFLSLQEDTMIMLRAVLDTNFWLATHVVIVTLGYASTFVAGLIGLIYLARAVFTPHVTKQMQKAFASMVFAIVCFASLFSFVGTVLGGIWADQSWGRFWGWDPKENGALIIVLWNVLILHARLGGLVKERGLLNLAVGGNIVTSWSWFGTNMLGIGLHSYGFMDSAYYTLLGFIAVNLIFIIIGCTPQSTWVSFQEKDEVPGAGPKAEVPAAV